MFLESIYMYIYIYIYTCHFLLRVIKQTLRSSGANVTEVHISEVSLAAMFLLDVTKKTDQQFQATQQSHSHTVRDAADDIRKIATYLTNKTVMIETQGRDRPEFTHPVQKGWEKLSKPEWITAVLSSTLVEEDERRRGEYELDYELSDVV